MRAYYHSTDTLSPSAFEILRAVKEREFPGMVLELAPVGETLPPTATVLAFGGGYKPKHQERIVAAPSVAQIVTKADIVTRLTSVLKMLADPPVLPPMRYRVVWGWQDALDLLNGTRGMVIAVDIETSGDVKVDLPDPSRLISVGLYGGGEYIYVLPEELCTDPDIYAALALFLQGNRIITVNGKFDLKYFPKGCNHYFDVQLAHYALFPAAGEHGLKPTAKRYFGLDDWDAPGKQYTKAATYKEAWHDEETGAWADARRYSANSGFERIPRKALYEYNAWDLYATWHLYLLMRRYLADDPDAQRVFDLLMELSDMFMGVERRGITLNIPYLEKLSAELTVEQAEAEAKLDEIAGRQVNPRSPKQVKKWFADAAVPLESTAEGVLTEFIETAGGAENEQDYLELAQPVDFAKQLLVCRGIAKQLGTYVDGYRNQAHGSTVYPGYRLIASTTGRLGGQGASMLTIPRDKRLKKMVIASGPGRCVVGADLSQAELRVMACESMDPWLIGAFQPGAGDFFDLLLTQAYPDTDWFTLHRRVGAHEAAEAEANFYNNKRASMKGVVYGVSFGRGTKAIAAALKISLREAQVLVDAFIRPGSEFDMWRTEISERAVNGQEIVTRFGRHFQSELVTRVNRQNVINSALSFTSQSTANDICLTATLAVDRQLENYDAWLMGTVHDAIYTDSPEEAKNEVGKLLTYELAAAGRAVYGDLVPFTADWDSGASMADI